MLSTLRKPVLWACAAAVGWAGIGGCTPRVYDVRHRFLDPGELSISEDKPELKRQGLLMPILTTLSTQFDAPENDFSTATDVTADDMKGETGDYVIGKNDLLAITITELVGPGIETLKVVRVTESGNISLPFIASLKATGLTESQLEQSIIQEYKVRNIIQNAQVSVSVQEARQRVFSMGGSINRPGQYILTKTDFTLRDALILGGESQVPNTEFLYIVRPPPTNPPAAPASQGGTTAPSTTSRPGATQPDPLEPRSALPAPDGGAAPSPAAPSPAAGRGDAKLGDDVPKGALATVGDDHPSAVFIGGTGKTPNNWVAKDAKGANDAKITLAAAAPGSPELPPLPDPLNPADLNKAPSDSPTAPPAPSGKPFAFNSPSSEPQLRIIRVPLDALLRGDFSKNVIIRPNDTIIVPNPVVGEYFMGGHVQRTGVYSLTGRQLTLKQAVVSAGMLDALAVPERCEVVRRAGRDREAREVFVRVNLAAILDGDAPDIFLKPNDVVFVGTNGAAPFLAAIRSAFRLTYGFGFLYDRNFNTSNGNSGF